MNKSTFVFLFACQAQVQTEVIVKSINKNNLNCYGVLDVPDLRCKSIERGETSITHTMFDLVDCTYDNVTLYGKFVERITNASNVIKVKCNGN
jgi:hypothetical protein